MPMAAVFLGKQDCAGGAECDTDLTTLTTHRVNKKAIPVFADGIVAAHRLTKSTPGT